ncbi:hypothetical protein INR49_014735, partial [Caranx melampygus]
MPPLPYLNFLRQPVRPKTVKRERPPALRDIPVGTKTEKHRERDQDHPAPAAAPAAAAAVEPEAAALPPGRTHVAVAHIAINAENDAKGGREKTEGEAVTRAAGCRSLNHFHMVFDSFVRDNEADSSSPITSVPPSGDIQPARTVSQLDRFRELDEALDLLENQNYYQAVGNAEQTLSPDQRPVSSEDGDRVREPSPPTPPPQSPQYIVVNCDRFNNVEIRQILQFPTPSDVPDYGEFYGGVMGAAQELCDRIFSQAQAQDVVQMELRGGHFNKTVSHVVRADGDDTGLATFQNLLDELVQSNMSLMTDQNLELVVQLVRNPPGAGRRKQDSMLDSEVVRKKRRFLYVVENPDNSLCFATNLAHLLHPSINGREAERIGREIQRRVGFTEHRDVCFSDMSLFERALD